ncbi:endoplasmic reticulum metallopeptidase [Achlya hypogyna]|uniref:Endoplasmic reticulum metallopeptidase n=1 Tax=Achlya hypogyna TaxID=1202772 RepID=A0A1V9Z938_ACHHY|nr:endoplasmic reticulum metallopeptidase [Achlya hypogyna]
MHQRKPVTRPTAGVGASDEDKKDGHKTSVSYVRAWIIVVWVAVVYGFVFWRHTWLPAPKDASIPKSEFSEERARVYLEELQAIEGFRTVGSVANEVATPAWLLGHLTSFQAQCTAPCVMDIEVQKPDGAFGLNFLAQFQNIYANVTNVVVRIHAAPEPTPPALLLSSHYDAAIGAAAASDDGVNIAIMLELLSNAVAAPPTTTALVFNFNGAEETFLQASHGFITQHPWRRSIAAFINLEAAGAGGRELLFQTGSDVLAMAYATGAPYPHASTIAQEIFKSGVVPGETDYRTYTEYGDVPGMDFAYVANGYVYHTPLDDISRIQRGAVQRFGDNVQGTIARLFAEPATLRSLGAHSAAEDHIFFDVFGYRTLTLPTAVSSKIHVGVVATVLLYLGVVSPVSWTDRRRAAGLLVRLSVSGFVAALVVVAVLSLYVPMSWYASPATRAWVFVFPCVAGFLSQLPSDPRELRALVAPIVETQSLLWLAVAVPMLVRGIQSVYLVMAWVLFPLAAHAVSSAIAPSPHAHAALLLAGVAVPLMHLAQVYVVALQVFVPIMGRAGTALPSDAVVGGMMALLALVTLTALAPVLCFVRPTDAARGRTAALMATLTCVLFACLSNPYSADCPKRLIVQHVHRNFSRVGDRAIAAEDSGIWLQAFDFQGLEPLRATFGRTPWATHLHAPATDVADTTIYDNLPWVYPIAPLMPVKNTWYLPVAPPPPVKVPTHLEVASSVYDANSDTRRLHLVLSGPSQINMYIDATTAKLTSWSLGNGKDGVPPQIDDVYIFQFSTGGLAPAEFHFWLDVASNTKLDVAYCGHYLDATSPELAAVAALLPSWATHTSFVSMWALARI